MPTDYSMTPVARQLTQAQNACLPVPGYFTVEDVRLNIQMHPSPNASQWARDATVVKDVTSILNVTLEMAEEYPESKAALTMLLLQKGLSISELGATTSGSKNLELANFTVSQSLKTLSLTKVASMTSPGRVTALVTLTMAEKAISAAGLGDVNKCAMAVAALTATSGMAGLTCVTTGGFTMGIGCFAGGLAIAADIFNVYGQCYAD